MSDEEISAFLESYRALADRAQWEPTIYSDLDLMHNRERRRDIRGEHDTRLKEEIAHGRIRLFDGNHVPQKMPRFEVSMFLPREDAQAYVEKGGAVPAGRPR